MTTFLGRHSEADDHIAQLVWLGHDVRVVSGGDDKAGVLDAFARTSSCPTGSGTTGTPCSTRCATSTRPRGVPIELVWDHAASLRARDRAAFDTVVDILEQVADERDDLHVTVVTR